MTYPLPISLIISADDLGVSKARNQGILAAVKAGGVTAVGLMVNGPAAAHGVILLRDYGCLDLVGLHLNLTEGCPVATPELVPSLLRATSGCRDSSITGGDKTIHVNGISSASRKSGWELLPGPLFLGKVEFTEACRLGTIVESHVQHEARAQLELFCTLVGRLPKNFDGHQHCHIMPGMPAALAPLLAEAGVRAVRIPEERGYLPAHPCIFEQPSHAHATTGNADVAMPPPCPPLLPFPMPQSPLSSAALGTEETKTQTVLCSSCSTAQVLSPPARALYSAHGFSSSCAFVGCSLCGLEQSYSASDLLAAIDTQIGIICAATTAAKGAVVPTNALVLNGSSDSSDADEVPSMNNYEGSHSRSRSKIGSFPAKAPKTVAGRAVSLPKIDESAMPEASQLVIEFMCHPGWPDAPEYDQGSPCWDAFSASGARAHEVEVLSDPAFHEGLANRGVQLLSHQASGLLNSMPRRGDP